MKGDVKEMTYQCGKYQACLWMVGRCWKGGKMKACVIVTLGTHRLVSGLKSLVWGHVNANIYIYIFTYIGYGRHPSSNCDHQNSSILSMGSLQILTCHCYWEGATPSIYIHIHIHQKASMSQVELQCFEPEDSSLIHGATSGFVKWYISVGRNFISWYSN